MHKQIYTKMYLFLKISISLLTDFSGTVVVLGKGDEGKGDEGKGKLFFLIFATLFAEYFC